VTGLEAIAANNGWNMARIGIFIVFTALVTLSLIISQLHKVLTLLEKRNEFIEKLTGPFKKNKKDSGAPEARQADDLNEIARQFDLLIKSKGEPFSLPKLIDLAGRIGIGSPYSTVNRLILAKLIVPDAKGFYRWDHGAYQNMKKEES